MTSRLRMISSHYSREAPATLAICEGDAYPSTVHETEGNGVTFHEA